MAKIIGAFIFKNDGDGCLTGKWLNNDEPTAYPEAAKFQNSLGEEGELFCGSYITTWIQQGSNPIHCNLKITKKKNSSVYNLEWNETTGNVLFYGTGMIYQDALIGSYWK